MRDNELISTSLLLTGYHLRLWEKLAAANGIGLYAQFDLFLKHETERCELYRQLGLAAAAETQR